MAFTIVFVGLQVLIATVFLAVTSKIAGPDVILYDTKLSPYAIQQIDSGNASYVMLGGDKLPVRLLNGVVVDGSNRLFLYRMDALTLALCSVLLLTFYVVYTFLKLPESSHHCSKISPDDDYCADSLQDHTHWLVGFFFCMFFSDFVIISFVCCPKQIDMCILFAYILSAQVEVVIAPREGEENSLQTLTRNLCGVVILMIWAFIWTQIRVDYDGVIFVYIVKIFCELLIVGYHTGSKRVMEHVVECRVLYALCNTILVVTMYLAWGHVR